MVLSRQMRCQIVCWHFQFFGKHVKLSHACFYNCNCCLSFFVVHSYCSCKAPIAAGELHEDGIVESPRSAVPLSLNPQKRRVDDFARLPSLTQLLSQVMSASETPPRKEGRKALCSPPISSVKGLPPAVVAVSDADALQMAFGAEPALGGVGGQSRACTQARVDLGLPLPKKKGWGP